MLVVDIYSALTGILALFCFRVDGCLGEKSSSSGKVSGQRAPNLPGAFVLLA